MMRSDRKLVSGNMQRILTITLNPALDLSTSVEHVIPGPKLRCKPPRVDPGGGGVNAARTILRLGGDVTALIASGGATGEQLIALLVAEAVPVLPVHVNAATRQGFAVTEEATGAQYRFNVPGQNLGMEDADHLLAQMRSAIPNEGIVVLSGSMAPGLPDYYLEQIHHHTMTHGARLIVDTSGPALTRLVGQPVHPVDVLRIDQKEAAEAARRPMASVEDSFAFAAELIDRGVARCVVTGRGREGSVMVTQDARYFCQGPDVTVRSKIGAGDAFVGALAFSLSRKNAMSEALQWGVAAATATVKTEGTALCELSDVKALLPACVVS